MTDDEFVEWVEKRLEYLQHQTEDADLVERLLLEGKIAVLVSVLNVYIEKVKMESENDK